MAGTGDTDEGTYRRLRAIDPRLSITVVGAYTGYAWADRALAIAQHCLPTQTEPNGRAWAAAQPDLPQLPAAPAPDADTCAVCFEDMTDAFPTPHGNSAMPVGVFHCTHTVCRTCDWDVQRSANPKCPMCRALRRYSTAMRP